MDEPDRIVLAMLREERHAAFLVAQLVNEGVDLDDALRLVRFPHDDA